MERKRFPLLANQAIGKRAAVTVLTGYTGTLDHLLHLGITNSAVCMERLQTEGYSGSLTSVKRYIVSHRSLVPAKRHNVDPQGNRGRRYYTNPGEAYQMDWGFAKVDTPYGISLRVACFAMICHHCGERYIEFFPNAKQENLFIGMIHAFQYMGIPQYVLTDNMKSVVLRRDFEGRPIWQKDYESFMDTIGFQTKLCKPYHPFTKGKVERLIQFVKNNFLAGRSFYHVTDLNRAALDWCNGQNNKYQRALDKIPQEVHFSACANKVTPLEMNDQVKAYLCPLRRISDDGFVNYEGLRFGVPYSYTKPVARVQREKNLLYIYSDDMKQLLYSYPVTWDRADVFCETQYAKPEQPEEFPTVPVHTTITMMEDKSSIAHLFEKFNFDKEDDDE